MLLVDPDRSYRRWLRTLLTSVDIDVVAEADDGARAASLTRSLAPDVVVVALDLEGTAGIEAAQSIRYHDPTVPIIALATFEAAAWQARSGTGLYLYAMMPKEGLIESRFDPDDPARLGPASPRGPRPAPPAGMRHRVQTDAPPDVADQGTEAGMASTESIEAEEAPMNVSARRRTFIAAGIVAVLILAGVGYAAWEVFGGSAPPAAALFEHILEPIEQRA